METATTSFVADGSGDVLIFLVDGITTTIDNVSLRKYDIEESGNEPAVKEFLEGNTDDGLEITFRADTQPIQLMKEFETFAVPLAIVSKLHRGSLAKCFVAIDGDEFYELEGYATKGTSIIKIHPQDRNFDTTPSPAREIRISWRDSSKQLCRLTQGGIVFLPSTMNYLE